MQTSLNTQKTGLYLRAKSAEIVNLMILKKLSALSETQVQILFTLLGIVIACQIMYIQHGWINDDSVLYFEIARLFSIKEWRQGLALFNWPLYPALISAVHQFTHLSLQTSAQLLNIIFFAVTTFSFISLIRLAGGKKTTIVCGAFLLLSSPYIVGDVLPMLLRDQGFWAMFLTSLVYFIQFYRHQKLSYALFWQISAIFAVLFRIEAITFLVCLPFTLLSQHEFSLKQNVTHFLEVNLIPILAIILIICILVSSPSVQLSDFGRLQEVVTIFPRMLTDIAHKFIEKANIMNEMVLGSFLQEYGMLTVIVSLTSIIMIKIAKLVGIPVIGLFALSFSKHLPTTIMQQDTRLILRWTLVLTLLNASIIMASVFVLSGRYIIALGFILLIFAAFPLAALVEKIRSHSIESHWLKAIFFLLLALIAYPAIVNLLPKQTGYNFEQDANTYLKQQQIPNSKVFYVTPRSRYFAGAPYAGRGYDYWDYTQKAIENGSIYQYDYLLINLNINDKFPAREKILTEKLHQYKVAKEFYGYKNKKKIMLYVRK